MSASGVTGNIFIFITIAWLGSIYLSLITTTRKIFSIFLSIVVNNHKVDIYRGTGVGLVILGILLEMITNIKVKMEKKKKKKGKKKGDGVKQKEE